MTLAVPLASLCLLSLQALWEEILVLMTRDFVMGLATRRNYLKLMLLLTSLFPVGMAGLLTCLKTPYCRTLNNLCYLVLKKVRLLLTTRHVTRSLMSSYSLLNLQNRARLWRLFRSCRLSPSWSRLWRRPHG